MITKRIPVAWVRILLVSLIVTGLIWEQNRCADGEFQSVRTFTRLWIARRKT